MEKFEPIEKLNKDLKEAAKNLSPNEARYLVDGYYIVQEYRKALGNQKRALTESREPSELISWLFDQHMVLENNIKKALDIYTDQHPIGIWAKSITGIGPVISAGLLAHIDITKAPTVGHIWSFAGLNPEQKWEKGQKRPWNAKLKTLCWKIGESFVKFSNNPKDFYGKLYKEYKEYYTAKNENIEYKDQAEKLVKSATSNYKKTEAYQYNLEGKLSPGHIHSRAKRKTVKIFLAHLHEVWYKHYYKTNPPKPYVIEHLGHKDYIAPPF